MRRFFISTSILILITFILILSGCGNFGNIENNSVSDELMPVSSIAMGEDEARKLSDKMPVHLYFSDDNKKLKMEVRYIPVEEAKKSINHAAGLIIKELIKGPKDVSMLKATIPEGTTLKSPVVINNGVATVNFSKEFIEKHPGGKENEALTIYSVVNSLTDLKEIQQVAFKIDGKVVEEYKGNFKLNSTFPKNQDIVCKDILPHVSSKSENLDKTETNKNLQEDASKKVNKSIETELDEYNENNIE